MVSNLASTGLPGAIFDTQKKEPETFGPSILLAKAQGLELQYWGIDQILDAELDVLIAAAGRVAFFQIDSQFLRGWSAEQNFIGDKYLKLLKILSEKSDCSIFLMLPPLGNDSNLRLEILKPLLQISGFSLALNTEQLPALKAFLDSPLETRKTAYHTALTPPTLQLKKSYWVDNFPQWHLPQSLPASNALLNNFYPMAFKLDLGKRSMFLSSAALLWLLSPSENFQLLPLEKCLLNHLPLLLSQFFLEVRNFSEGKFAPPAVLQAHEVVAFDKIFETLQFAGKKQQDAAAVKFSKVSWMEIADFCESSPWSLEEKEAKLKVQKCLIDRTLDAKLDWVWINLSPNTFLSENSINASQSEATIAGLKCFGEQLMWRAHEKQQPMPKFLLGFELGNNIVGSNSPKNPAHDIFNNCYSDIPEPLDFDFWKEELLKPLKSFLDLWNGNEGAKILPVQGVVADIEFYNRRWTSSFLPTMGFGKNTRELFAMQDGDKRSGRLAVSPFVKNLMAKKKCQHYFSFLQKSSEQLGIKIRTQVNKLLPGRPFSVYLPNLVFDWFHTGFFKGLSQKAPIHIFSFNSNYNLTAGLMEKKGIKASHSAPFMLSKLVEQENFGLVETLLSQNKASSAVGQTGGVWLNRFSRIAHPFKPGEWYFLEQSTASSRTRDQFCRTISRLN